MRRLLLPLALVVLTGTLVAQTPQTIPLTQPDKFNVQVTFLSTQQNGDVATMKSVSFKFQNGVTLLADEAMFDKSKDGVIQLSGNVRMTLK